MMSNHFRIAQLKHAVLLTAALSALAIPACADDAGAPSGPGSARSTAGAGSRSDSRSLAGDEPLTNARDVAELYGLQSSFHAAASVRDAVNGDSPDVIQERIREMLALWTEDGVLQLAVGNASRDGIYAGRGDPSDPATCPVPSGVPAHQGTLCTFFKYVGGSFQAANKFVSLAPSYKTRFTVHGATGTINFECHYFDVSTTNPTSSNNAPWTPKSHVQATGHVARVGGRWLFSYLNAPLPAVPVGY
jgi:hypothetical protein